MEKHIVIKSENTQILQLALALLENMKDLEVQELLKENADKNAETPQDLPKAMFKLSSKVFDKYID